MKLPDGWKSELISERSTLIRSHDGMITIDWGFGGWADTRGFRFGFSFTGPLNSTATYKGAKMEGAFARRRDRLSTWTGAVMTVEGPQRVPLPRTAVLAFMASLALAAGYSANCYVDALMLLLGRPFEGGD